MRTPSGIPGKAFIMNVFHGTTKTRARRIFDQGLLPFPPSNRVWFTEDRAYATGRAKTQARRNRDAPRVLSCDISVDATRQKIGGKGVIHRKGIIAVDGPVTIEMMRSISIADLATVPIAHPSKPRSESPHCRSGAKSAKQQTQTVTNRWDSSDNPYRA